ncbi:hypothetical protein BDV40DRAFT_5849 [Aspergillus tamarii]|uniref:Uncharacterized protein n=1 Tax=Aspergillus tamarii TaxID=41984 RepID=A0A5N6V749_ASPTM|nr:hypothetical protein BDV40DRAFT_5849 [Aspergillus tamarii]
MDLTGLIISCIYSLACYRALLDTARCRYLAYSSHGPIRTRRGHTVVKALSP